MNSSLINALWLAFAICAAGVVVSDLAHAENSDEISERLKMARMKRDLAGDTNPYRSGCMQYTYGCGYGSTPGYGYGQTYGNNYRRR
jgi:hypothetical protein